jgi:hypothetical protein
MDSVELRPHPDVVSRQVGEELVLVHLKTNRIYSLNRTGTRLWELLGSGCGREALERQLLDEFDVDEAQLREEIEGRLAEFAREGLLA